MAPNKSALLLLTVFLLIMADALRAQETGFFIDYSGDKPRIFQRFEWDKDEFAMRYEIEIQFFYEYKEGDEEWFPGGFYEYFKDATAENIIEIDLPPGKYRFCVTPFDFLMKSGESSEWIEFEVYTAHIPIIGRFFPKSFLLDKEQERVLTVRILNISIESEIYLRSEQRNLYPVRIEYYRDNIVKLFFIDDFLPPGEYEIYVMNPEGGIETAVKGFNIEYSKAMDVFFKAAYTPVSPVYGKINDLFNEGMYSTGLAFSLEFISSRRSFLNGGFELSVSTYYLSRAFSFKTGIQNIINSFNDAGDGMLAADFDFNVTLQKRFFNKRMAFSLRFGFGLSGLFLFGQEQGNSYAAHYNLSLCYMILLSDILYLEIGADFTHYDTEKFFGIVKPRLALAWKI